MKHVLLAAVVAASAIIQPLAAQSPGALTAEHFDPTTDVRAPEDMTWMACYLALGWVGSPYGSVNVMGGPYLVERPDAYTTELQRDYTEKFAAEYLQARPREFPQHEPKPAFASQRGCIIGTHSFDTARFWDAPRKNPGENLKTDFVPSFAR